MRKVVVLLAFCAFFLGFSAMAGAAELQSVAGAGPSTTIVQLFFDHFSQNPAAQNFDFKIPPRSAKHAGGIKNSDDFLFGRTGRPLNEKEKGMNKSEIILARVPIAFATGAATGVSRLSLSELEKIFTGQVSNWKEVGGADAAIVLVGREKTEALFSVLRKDQPFFDNVSFAQVFKKDHQVVNFLKSPEGANAIAFGAKPNFGEVNLIAVDGFSAGVSLGLVYDQKNQTNPVIEAAKTYADSAQWKQLAVQSGLLAAN